MACSLLCRFDLVSGAGQSSRCRVTLASGNHGALEQFVGDGRRHAVEELRPHLWIVLQDLHGTLLHLRLLHSWGLASLLLKGLTG